MKCILVDDIEYIQVLEFMSASCYIMLKKEVERMPKENEEVVKASWFGSFFKKEIEEGYLAKLSLKWINGQVGYGVFARSGLNEGAYVGEYVGEVKKYFPLRMRRNDYLGELRLSCNHALKFIIDAERRGNLMRCVNHSVNPNLEPITVILKGMMHVIFVAKKKIEAGEQITFNYGQSYWKTREAPINW